MGQKRYRGPVETVERAMWANMVLHITCRRCSRPRCEWAYKLCQRKPMAKAIPLNKTVSGFYCRGCKRSVSVYIQVSEEGAL
jgi:hypothetical protein